jgi:rhodanese-related sulfurtransferase
MVGIAARRDLFGPTLSWRFAHDLEHSLKERILTLTDDVIVYPTHGGGSFCAVGAGSPLTTTIGAERAAKALATSASSRQFVTRSLIAGPYPTYYARMRTLNQAGAPLLGTKESPPPPLGLGEFDIWLHQGTLALDVRPAASFRAGHIPGSVAAGADGNASGWIGWLVGSERPLALVADPGEEGAAQVTEATRQLARIDYDRVVGVLDGGIDIWQTSGRTLTGYETISAAVLAERLDAERFLTVIDVREPFEWYADHLPGSVNLPAHDIETASLKLPRGVALAVHCGHDYRATLGASLSERAGHPDLVVLEDGWEGWAALDLDDWS